LNSECTRGREARPNVIRKKIGKFIAEFVYPCIWRPETFNDAETCEICASLDSIAADAGRESDFIGNISEKTYTKVAPWRLYDRNYRKKLQHGKTSAKNLSKFLKNVIQGGIQSFCP
jgi:hypothetical protein